MSARALSVVVLGLLLVPLAGAKPPFLEAFRKEFAFPAESDVGAAQCGVCHQGPPRRNPFGGLVEAQLQKSGKFVVDGEILKAIGEMQAPDGRSFREVIESGQRPSSAMTPSEPPVLPVDQEPVVEPLDKLAPRHSFHPLLVHFPIALFLFSALIEVVGARTGRAFLRQSAKWSIGVAAAGAVCSVATGLAAFLRLGMAFEGPPAIHVTCALMAATLILTTLFFKLQKQDEVPAYWILLVFGSVLVAATGHFGAALVFG